MLPVEFKFTPLELFEWWRPGPDGEDRLIGQYHPGMTYNCTKNPVHDQLRVKCGEWLEEEKIKIMPLAEGQRFRMLEVK